MHAHVIGLAADLREGVASLGSNLQLRGKLRNVSALLDLTQSPVPQTGNLPVNDVFPLFKLPYYAILKSLRFTNASAFTAGAVKIGLYSGFDRNGEFEAFSTEGSRTDVTDVFEDSLSLASVNSATELRYASLGLETYNQKLFELAGFTLKTRVQQDIWFGMAVTTAIQGRQRILIEGEYTEID